MAKNLLFILNAILISQFISSCASRPSSELVQKSPTEKKAELYYDYGTNALVEKNYTKALTNLKQAIALIEEDTRFHNNLGMAYYFKGDSKMAIRHLERSLDIDDKNSDAKNNLASIYFNLGKLEQAKSLYLEVLKNLEYTKQYRINYNLGLIEKRQGNEQKAILYFNQAVKEKLGYCPAHLQLGNISFKKHYYQQAANSYQKATLGSCANTPSLYLKEGTALLELREYGKGLLKLQEIKKKFPESKEAILAERKIKMLKVTNYRSNEEKLSKSRYREERKQPVTTKQSTNKIKSADF
jgi:type IV pilus assembly protein PilF